MSMDAATTMFVKKAFAAYYQDADFRIPSIEQREFGIGNQKKIDARHLNFATFGEFRSYLCTNTPLFVSHSTAYYEFPGASPMQKKIWMGADLVFDLDIHAEGKYGAYAKLDEVKEDAIRLLDDFILSDFGVKREHVTIVFSGNRGYHIHVRDPAFIPLGGEERRELVDYVMGQGLDYMQFFPPLDKKTGKLTGPIPDEGGYRGRFARAVIGMLQKEPERLSRLFTKDKEREFFIGGIEEGNWGRTSLKYKDILARLKPIADQLPVGSVNTDAGVTQDLSKLIRVPNSIHGDTGLIAKIVDDIEGFAPWRDASLKGEPLKVRFLEDVPRLDLDETAGPFKKDEEKELPRHQALLFLCKGSAALV